MKLIHKTISYYLLISIPLMILAGVFAYFEIKGKLTEEMDEILTAQSNYATEMITNFDSTKNESKNFNLGYESITSVKIVQYHNFSTSFSDSSIFSAIEKEIVPYRVIKTYVPFDNKTYLLTIAKPTIEEDDLLESLFSTFVLIIFFSVLSFFIVNWWISKNLWSPFYKSLSKLYEYDIKQHHSYQFDKSSIKEFDQLNTTLTAMTEKLYADFIQQKEFTENASHEMQTPLAVVKANVSLLLQSPNLKEQEMNQLQAIDNTTKKLTALNKALILLSKIENHQFNENIPVNFNDKLKSTLSHYQDLLIDRKLLIETVFDNDLIVSFNPTLADVLISNLLQNAIRHNQNGGTISISINNRTLTISNSGSPLSISEDELFVRFKKNDASKDSLGLGLSIVKSIASLYNMHVSYKYLANKHVFVLDFN